MRLFLGLFPPDELQLRMGDAMMRLRAGALAGAPLRWTASAQLHLTLRFLGEQDPDFVAGLRAALPGLLGEFRSFRISCAGLGAFPRAARARVLFAEILEGREELVALGERMEPLLRSLGLPAEARPLHPHLTLARARRAPIALPPAESLRWPELSWSAAVLRLVSSEAAARGRRYQLLEEFRLGS